MRMNEDNETVRAMDILFPGIGEIVGGSQREERLEKLKARMDEMDVCQEELWWYLETQKFGSCPHSGFGLGFERLIMFVTGMKMFEMSFHFHVLHKTQIFRMQKQRLQQNQQLKLSPQQIQFLSLLQIPIVSLEKRIEEELEDNPALEEDEKLDEETWDEEYNYRPQLEKEDNSPVIAEREETLQEFLLKQLPMQNLNENESFLATFLIGSLDSNGFLSERFICYF